MIGNPQYEEARQRMEEVKGFYIHLAIYLAVNLGLVIIDAVQGGGWWFYWATIGWGIGILAHAVALFFSTGRTVRTWEENKIEKYLEETPPDRDSISTNR